MNSKIEDTIELPSGISAQFNAGVLTVTGPKGKVTRDVAVHGVDIATQNNAITLSAENVRLKRMLNTTAAHIRNMVKGAKDGYVYRLAIVFSHFPINAAVKKDVLEINNFIGEKKPRLARIIGETKVEVKGRDVLVSGANRDHVGQTAANIEGACRIRDKDRRVFQDGIYILQKAGE